VTLSGRGQTFSTRELLNILDEAGLHVDVERLKVWHRRRIAPGDPVGKGRERSYTLEHLIAIASLVFVSRRVGARGAGRADRSAFADTFAEAVYSVYRTGPDGDVARGRPVYILADEPQAHRTSFKRIDGNTKISVVAQMYATGTATIVQAGFFAMQLAAAVERVSSGAVANSRRSAPRRSTSGPR
jgi:hypothetical protein